MRILFLINLLQDNKIKTGQTQTIKLVIALKKYSNLPITKAVLGITFSR
ncbi:MAG TPA: hypothetical protein PKL13_00970 [bacterium]|nr:hypothetical protein [bacterium]